ncbi:MAG TPA: hypothetical protein VHR45_00725 [Thermoanaerobaculia bacterium]|nr:hypothetical protein [Thermoanaerobaculia bacterium]
MQPTVILVYRVIANTLDTRREGLRLGPEGAVTIAAAQDLAVAGAFAPSERVVVVQTGDPANYLSPVQHAGLQSPLVLPVVVA